MIKPLTGPRLAAEVLAEPLVDVRLPVGITGVNRTSRLSWITGTIADGDPEEVIAFLAGPLGGYVERRDFGTRWYQASAPVGLNGSMVAWSPRAGRPGEVYVCVVQADLDALGSEAVALLTGLVVLLGLRPSRIDVAVDDRDPGVRPLDLVQAFDAGQTVTRVKARRYFDNGDGTTGASFGSRKSDAWYFRPYEKLDDAGRFLRLELESLGEQARAVAARLVGGESVASVALGYITGVLDFRQRAEGSAHGERGPRLGWWARLVDGAERVRVAPRVRVDLMVKRVRWCQRAVARTLASAWLTLGDDWLSAVLETGMERLTARDRAVMSLGTA